MTQAQPPTKRLKHGSKRAPISTYVSVQRHPLGVKPSGNTLLSSSENSNVDESLKKLMGKLYRFDDELLLHIMSYLCNPQDLLNISHCSRALYCYGYQEELWKNIYLKNGLQIQKWRGSWRKSILGLQTEALIQAKGYLYSDLLYRPYQCSRIDYNQIFKRLIAEEEAAASFEVDQNEAGHIQRIQEAEMTQESFNEKWHNTPFILANKEAKRWPLESSSVEHLLENYSNETMRQEAVRWPVELYFEYLKQNQDENPLYLFDPANKIIQELEFEIPQAFQQDLFNLFEHSRPDHRWIIIGPARSGSTFHKDPNTTSAWNTTLQGKKIWVMTPPHVTPPGVSADSAEEEVTSPIGIAEWVLSGFFNDAVRMSQTNDCLIGVTFPGECLYVPSGWWHTVINVDNCVAITQNFMPLMKLDKVLKFFRDKNEQISGFHPNEVYLEMLNLLPKLNDEEESKFFTEKLEQLSKFKDESEDIGELTDVKLPIYEIFVSLLKSNGYESQLEQSLARLKELSRPQQEKVWNQITVQKSSFSFDFEEDH